PGGQGVPAVTSIKSRTTGQLLRNEWHGGLHCELGTPARILGATGTVRYRQDVPPRIGIGVKGVIVVTKCAHMRVGTPRLLAATSVRPVPGHDCGGAISGLA
ncbi:MAG TPA: hypothetical protein VE735_01350, partial [Gammaproteobacteria bacterium]|nr:hypothetical protein [Gammaproteobacteria bacterium]